MILLSSWYDCSVDIAFSLFNQIPIHSFSLILGIGVLIGLHGVINEALVEGNDTNLYLNFTLLILLGSLLGGRAAYIGLHWAYFQQHLDEILRFWLGGLGWVGALGGGIITLTIIALLRGRHFGDMCDTILPLLTAMTISIWLGCWVAGTAYGPKVDAWWGIPVQDMRGDVSIRWPLQPLGALLTVGISWGISAFWSKLHTPGLRFALTLAGISLMQLGLSALRVDPGPFWNGARLDLWAALVFFTSSTLIAIMIYMKAYTHLLISEKS
ncbi:MAG: prolipoprotein diacylglyceryl transferase [Chloroflexi bacterium]|nr:prolipoprotein diacylglyceryl transferase [Chloroflexota bacterium]